MRMRRKAPVPAIKPSSPSRTAVQASPARRRRGPAAATTSSQTAEPGDVAVAQVEAAAGEGQADDQERAELSTPLIPLTLRAMHSDPPPPTRSSARPAFVLLSVLALLAFACFPVLAQAETDYEPEYDQSPEVAAETRPPTHNNPGGGGKSSECPAARRLRTLPVTAAAGPVRSGIFEVAERGIGQGSNPSSPGGRRQGRQGKPGKGAGQASQAADGSRPGRRTAVADSDSGGSSSPLVPILIAIAVLAAISIGAVVIRQRRQRRGPGARSRPRRADPMSKASGHIE